MAWLSTTTRPWLIVLDDVQVPAEIEQWWPDPTKTGQVIVTTRYRGDSLIRVDRQVIEVGLYTFEQALEYLHRRLDHQPHLLADPRQRTSPDDLLAALAHDLGYLPLALSHASAYLREGQVSVTAYRMKFADYRTRLEKLFVPPDQFPDRYQDTVAATWTVSIHKAAELMPGGVVPMVMLLASVLDPDGIPRSVFASDAVGSWVRSVLRRAPEDGEVMSAVRMLHRFNLLTDNPAEGTTPVISVHGLVQRATRDAALRTEHAWLTTAHAASDALLEVWPDVERDTALAAALRSNTEQLVAVADVALWGSGAIGVLFRYANSLGRAGMETAAVAYLTRLAATARDRLGPEHRHTLAARQYLARWQGEAGDPAGAATALAELLDDMTRVLGTDDPLSVLTRNSLGEWQGRRGNSHEAAATLHANLNNTAHALAFRGGGTLFMRAQTSPSGAARAAS
ncbi:hypothetical protein BCF44_106480 [Kutzneria buriramensis]|uniref:NB-ARC domain-containing protein n=2 Tax=Kutzneria buriramensis TaxID=1045776 RepID=A0A3E0HMT4_9PSEU|nr:hypothetical protein BCF44_106480 [Kutzneria buriramensis]